MITRSFRTSVAELAAADGSGWIALNSISLHAGDRIVLDVGKSRRPDQRIATTLSAWLPSAHIELIGHPVAVAAWEMAMLHPDWATA